MARRDKEEIRKSLVDQGLPALLTSEEVRVALSISDTQLRDITKDGTLKSYKMPWRRNSIRYLVADVMALVSPTDGEAVAS